MNAAQDQKSGRLLTRIEVEEQTRLSRSSIYRQMEQGTFPRAVRVGIRAVAWWESDIEAWKNSLRPAGQHH